ncbi:hypothetical protein LXL04_020443 [Taraxacum kok-saghyz]
MAFTVAMPTVWTWLFHQDRAACMKNQERSSPTVRARLWKEERNNLLHLQRKALKLILNIQNYIDSLYAKMLTKMREV